MYGPATEDKTTARLTLGGHLASIRRNREMTLRQVEEATDNEVSNAYLSQLENNKIRKPSPNVLHRLSEIYGCSYEKLMELAGYLTSVGERNADQRHGRVATFAEYNLTQEEEEELREYLEFLRAKKRKRDDKT